MKAFLFAAMILAMSAFSHPQSAPGYAVIGFAALWNGAETLNHFKGLAEDVHWLTRLHHAIEFVGHTVNLVVGAWEWVQAGNLAVGAWEWVQAKSPPLLLTVGSFAFNVWGAWAQFDTLKGRNHQTYWAYILSAAAAIDVWGHAASAWVAGSELVDEIHKHANPA